MTKMKRSGRPLLNPRFIDVGAAVRGAVKRLLTTFAGTQAVTIVGPAHALHGWWDPTAVEQIVTNLVSNALKFGQGRSVRVTVRAAPGGVTISVRDQGAGISPADRLRLFKRHHHAPAARGGGMGLGLWLVRELALAHGGRVTLQSRRGRGSTFAVLLRTQPVLGSHRNAQAMMPRLPPQRSSVRTVSSKAAMRGPIPAYWQERLARSQEKVPLLARNEIVVAPSSAMTSPSLTAILKSKWPSRTRKSNDASAARSSMPRRPLNRSRNFASPTMRGSGP